MAKRIEYEIYRCGWDRIAYKTLVNLEPNKHEIQGVPFNYLGNRELINFKVYAGQLLGIIYGKTER